MSYRYGAAFFTIQSYTFLLLCQHLAVAASGMRVILGPLLDHMAFLNQMGCLNSFSRLFKKHVNSPPRVIGVLVFGGYI